VYITGSSAGPRSKTSEQGTRQPDGRCWSRVLPPANKRLKRSSRKNSRYG